MRRFVVGDIHGCYDQLETLLTLMNFSSDDILYGVGDYCDKGTQNLSVLTLLTSLPNFVGIIGNHDIWAYLYLESLLGRGGFYRDLQQTWSLNGGDFTRDSFKDLSEEEIIKFRNWYGNLSFQIELENVIIKHSASTTTLEVPYNNNLTLKGMLEGGYCDKEYDGWVWDRSLDKYIFGKYRGKKMYLKDGSRVDSESYYEKFFPTNKWTIYGHTPHTSHGPHYDKKFKLINIDCGAFVTREEYNIPKGQLCIIDLDTFEWFKSNGEKGQFEKECKNG